MTLLRASVMLPNQRHQVLALRFGRLDRSPTFRGSRHPCPVMPAWQTGGLGRGSGEAKGLRPEQHWQSDNTNTNQFQKSKAYEIDAGRSIRPLPPSAALRRDGDNLSLYSVATRKTSQSHVPPNGWPGTQKHGKSGWESVMGKRRHQSTLDRNCIPVGVERGALGID